MSYAYLRLLRIKDEWWQRANNRLTWSPGYAKTEDPRRTVAMEHARIPGLPSNRSSKAGILPSMNCTYLLPPIGSSQTRAVLARPIQYHQNLYGLSHRAPAPIPKNAIAHTNGTSLIPPNQNISCKIRTQKYVPITSLSRPYHIEMWKHVPVSTAHPGHQNEPSFDLYGDRSHGINLYRTDIFKRGHRNFNSPVPFLLGPIHFYTVRDQLTIQKYTSTYICSQQIKGISLSRHLFIPYAGHPLKKKSVATVPGSWTRSFQYRNPRIKYMADSIWDSPYILYVGPNIAWLSLY